MNHAVPVSNEPNSKPKSSRQPGKSPFKSRLKKELDAVGLDGAKALKLLPDWWEEVAESLGGQIEIRGWVAQFFGLIFDKDGNFLRPPSAEPEIAFRAKKDSDITKLKIASDFALAVAKQILRVVPETKNQIIPSAEKLRQEILAKGKPWVGFDDLLEICWSRNIPVIYMTELPMTHKMDGMVLRYDNKYAIILSKKAQNDHPSRLLFVLAHEIGHISCHHLAGEQSQIAEETVNNYASEAKIYNSDASRKQETEADAYARLLLIGENTEFNYGNLTVPNKLGQAVNQLGKEKMIEPGFIALNASHNFAKSGRGNAWGLTENVLQKLNIYDSGCLALCQRYFIQNIAFDELKVEAWEVLQNLKVVSREL
ncbi:MAG: ImmA/IrrE family metallo-endopeptidase [Candidatus Symbiobacter sp.]|nr:ImmA/IrrE family metallo-endopeptidase [Candidatus Symbiobacter sp.]